MEKSEFNHYSNTHLNIHNMSQYLKVNDNHADIINHFINIFESECNPEDFASCLEDVLLVYCLRLAKDSSECFAKNDHEDNVFYLSALIAAFRRPNDNHFFLKPKDHRIEITIKTADSETIVKTPES